MLTVADRWGDCTRLFVWEGTLGADMLEIAGIPGFNGNGGRSSLRPGDADIDWFRGGGVG